MKSAVLFPGQGEAVEEALVQWYEHSTRVRALVDTAAVALRTPVASLFSRGCMALRRTSVLQPVTTALSLGILDELTQRGLDFDIVGGHSLGEIPALAASGLLTPQAAVGVATVRGRLMEEAADASPGGMVAVAMGPGPELDGLMARVDEQVVLTIAAYNSPAQVVLSGTSEAIRTIQESGRVKALPVTGAWHSPLMSTGVEPLRRVLSSAITGAFLCPMAFNRTGRIEPDSARVPELLAHQLVHPVRWVAMMESLQAAGVRDVVIPGPAQNLRGIVRDCLGGEVSIRVAETPRDLGHVVQTPVTRA